MAFAYEEIANITLATDQTTVSFSSIPQDYQHLRIVGDARVSYNNTTGRIRGRLNGVTSSVYFVNLMGSSGSSTTTLRSGATDHLVFGLVPGLTATSGHSGAFSTDIYDYASANKTCSIKTFTGCLFYVNNGVLYMGGGGWTSTDAVTQIDLSAWASGDIVAGSTFTLYGLRSAL